MLDRHTKKLMINNGVYNNGVDRDRILGMGLLFFIMAVHFVIETLLNVNTYLAIYCINYIQANPAISNSLISKTPFVSK